MVQNEEILKGEVAKYSQKSELYESLIELDWRLIKGNLDNLKDDYRELKDKDAFSFFHSDWIHNRLARIDSILLKSEADKDNVEYLKKEISRSRSVADSNRMKWENDISNRVAELQSGFERKVDSLQQKLDEQNKIIKRKERIKVLSFKSLAGKNIHYLGEVENEMANGNGIGIWSNGSIYRGSWKDNRRHGKGEFSWAGGDTYHGDFKEGSIEGTGTYTWPSGERYEGQFVGNRRNGQGTLYDPDGNVSFKGKWINDKPQ